jgi:hypothetical protein
MKRISFAAIVLIVICSAAVAEELSLTIGSSVAGQEYTFKSANFLLRVNGCSAPAKPNVTGSAEGIVAGERRSVSAPLRPLTAPPNAWAVGLRNSPGKWVVSITAVCGNNTAGAIVPLNEQGFSREDIQMLQHAPTPAEIDIALKPR